MTPCRWPLLLQLCTTVIAQLLPPPDRQQAGGLSARVTRQGQLPEESQQGLMRCLYVWYCMLAQLVFRLTYAQQGSRAAGQQQALCALAELGVYDTAADLLLLSGTQLMGVTW